MQHANCYLRRLVSIQGVVSIVLQGVLGMWLSTRIICIVNIMYPYNACSTYRDAQTAAVLETLPEATTMVLLISIRCL